MLMLIKVLDTINFAIEANFYLIFLQVHVIGHYMDALFLGVFACEHFRG